MLNVCVSSPKSQCLLIPGNWPDSHAQEASWLIPFLVTQPLPYLLVPKACFHRLCSWACNSFQGVWSVKGIVLPLRSEQDYSFPQKRALVVSWWMNRDLWLHGFSGTLGGPDSAVSIRGRWSKLSALKHLRGFSGPPCRWWGHCGWVGHFTDGPFGSTHILECLAVCICRNSLNLIKKRCISVSVSYNSVNPKPGLGDNLEVWGGEGGAIKRRRRVSPKAYGRFMSIMAKTITIL